MRIVVRPKYGFIKYREGVFTDVDEYFLYLVTGDLDHMRSIPFECRGCTDEKSSSKLYFSIVMNEIERRCKKYRSLLSDFELGVDVYVFPSVALDPPDFSAVKPGLRIYENFEGYTFAVVYDSVSGRLLALQKVRWELVDGVDVDVFVEVFKAMWPGSWKRH